MQADRCRIQPLKRTTRQPLQLLPAAQADVDGRAGRHMRAGPGSWRARMAMAMASCGSAGRA